MEDFTKTSGGKKFIEHDLPKLIEVLGKLTNAMLDANKIEEKRLLMEQKRFINEKNENARITRSRTNRIESSTEDL